MYSAPNYQDITSDQDSADSQHYPVGESYSDAKETGELYLTIQIQGSIAGLMEDAVGFLIIPAPHWWGEVQG